MKSKMILRNEHLMVTKSFFITSFNKKRLIILSHPESGQSKRTQGRSLLLDYRIVHFQSIGTSRCTLGSRRWNWKFREFFFLNPNPDFLLHSSYSSWLWLSTGGSDWDIASPLPWKMWKTIFIFFTFCCPNRCHW